MSSIAGLDSQFIIFQSFFCSHCTFGNCFVWHHWGTGLDSRSHFRRSARQTLQNDAPLRQKWRLGHRGDFQRYQQRQ